MIIEYIRYQVSDAQTFTDAYTRAQASLDASPQCLAYELSRCTEDDTFFTLRIEWDSLAGHLEGFRKSPEFGPFLAAIRPFIGQIQEMRHYEVTAISRRK
ncbi:MAG TPA: antibiotic biosynthesis monooxygenase family protein [Polyangiaceae bacterium]|nr:antibiotic biosynthesis monooxygenase family protein [Polyangiaceae bacterium]